MKLSAFVAAFGLLITTTSLAQDVVTATTVADAGFSSSGYHVGIGYASSDGRFTNEAAAQLFIPEVSGLLTTVTASVDPIRGGEPLQVSVFTSSGGVPGTNLGTVAISETEMSNFTSSDWEMNTFDLSGLNIELVAGNSYFMVFRTATAIVSSSRYRAVRVAVNENSVGASAMYSENGGQTWKSSSSAPEIGVIVRVAGDIPPVEANIAVLSDGIKLKGKLKPLPVAIFSDANLNALDFDPATAVLGDPVLTDPETGSGQPEGIVNFYYSDINEDGLTDLVLEFSTEDLVSSGGIDSTTTLLFLEAQTFEGGSVFGLTGVRSKGNGKGNSGKGKGKPQK